jgi:hypothetical protein
MCGAAQAKLLGESRAAIDATDLIPLLLDQEHADEAAARALAERRQAMIEDCEQNNGTDCAREADSELRAEQLQGTGVSTSGLLADCFIPDSVLRSIQSKRMPFKARPFSMRAHFQRTGLWRKKITNVRRTKCFIANSRVIAASCLI